MPNTDWPEIVKECRIDCEAIANIEWDKDKNLKMLVSIAASLNVLALAEAERMVEWQQIVKEREWANEDESEPACSMCADAACDGDDHDPEVDWTCPHCGVVNNGLSGPVGGDRFFCLQCKKWDDDPKETPATQ